MRRILGLATAALVAVAGTVTSCFGTVIFSESFDPSNGANTAIQAGYSFGDTTARSSVIGVGTGVGGTNSWETQNTTSANGNGFSGVGAQYQHKVTAGNTSTNPGDYTLDFDMKADGGSVLLNIQTWLNTNFGGGMTGTISTAPAAGFGNDLTTTPGYTHYSVNLGDTNIFHTIQPAFNPAGGTYQITFQFDGTGAAPFTQTLDVDNLTLTMKGVPEPASLVLLGLAMPAIALIARRRRK
jgi:PEP-CTERM motif